MNVPFLKKNFWKRKLEGLLPGSLCNLPPLYKEYAGIIGTADHCGNPSSHRTFQVHEDSQNHLEEGWPARRCAVARPGPQPSRGAGETQPGVWVMGGRTERFSAQGHRSMREWAGALMPRNSATGLKFLFCLRVSEKFSLGTGEVNHGDLKLGFADRHRWLVGVQTSPVLYLKGAGWVFSSGRLGPAAHAPEPPFAPAGASGKQWVPPVPGGSLNSALSGLPGRRSHGPKGPAHGQTGPGCLTSQSGWWTEGWAFLAGGGVLRDSPGFPFWKILPWEERC